MKRINLIAAMMLVASVAMAKVTTSNDMPASEAAPVASMSSSSEVFDLYYTSSKSNWKTWKELTPVNGTDNEFWTIVYFEKGEKFKFAPQEGWGDDFGMSAKINDFAGIGLTRGTNYNCVVGKAGWYLLHVVFGARRVINIFQPNVYLIGKTAGEWKIDDSHRFTVPETKDGKFVSPAFAANGKLRICAFDGLNIWWKTEFIVKDGKIQYRGRGNDQDRVNVSAGQKVYLDFTNNTGEIK